ncbi:recombinase family protein [Orrella marina]|uniref:Recombinase n=1 Tax=Orrella marina TaxID=2163011 RepID=A0A2R4XPB2_9BURK|nr:recombinase family protein [Orrella marina]AWB35615.1 recombinase [Orrella marina]
MNQRIGYARISTDDQHLDLQRDALTQAECGVIYEEAASGKNTARPELEQCRKALRAGDTLVVWRLDRLGRSLPDLVQIVSELEQRGVGFESLTEKIETGSASGKLVFHVFAALAEFERGLIRERTQARLAAARARGRAGGRKPKLDDQQVREIRALLRDPGMQVADVARRYGVSRTTLYKHVGVVTPRMPRSENAATT